MAQRHSKQKQAKEQKIRDHRLNIRFLPKEIATLKQAAEYKHISISSFARSAVLEAAEDIMRHSFEANGIPL